MTLEQDEFGRPVVYLSEWVWYGGQARGSALFSNLEEGMKYAHFQARGAMNWSTFPDPAKRYPYDDRDGTEKEPLSPIFRASWDVEGSGYVQVTKVSVSEIFDWAATNK